MDRILSLTLGGIDDERAIPILMDIASDDNKISDAISYYSKAADMVPSYDLMVVYSIALIDLYLEEENLNKANKIFDKILSSTKDVENLPRSTQNNIDFIEYKLKQLNK